MPTSHSECGGTPYWWFHRIWRIISLVHSMTPSINQASYCTGGSQWPTFPCLINRNPLRLWGLVQTIVGALKAFTALNTEGRYLITISFVLVRFGQMGCSSLRQNGAHSSYHASFGASPDFTGSNALCHHFLKWPFPSNLTATQLKSVELA